MPIKVYIDQGHNPSGFNTGAEGNGYYEQDITYEIGRRLYNLLLSNPEFTPRLSRIIYYSRTITLTTSLDTRRTFRTVVPF